MSLIALCYKYGLVPNNRKPSCVFFLPVRMISEQGLHLFPYNLREQLDHFVGMVYHQLPMLHAREASDVAMGSECREMAKHVFGYEGFVLAVPVVYIGAVDTLKARSIDRLVGIAHGTSIA